MKKIFLFIQLSLFGLASVYSQNNTVGINTTNPQHLLHIDGKGNTTTSAATKTDDVIVTDQGNVGIGITTTPSSKLEVDGNVKGASTATGSATIQGTVTTDVINVGGTTSNALVNVVGSGSNLNFRLKDGTESSGHLLTCDQAGNAYWDGLRPSSSIVYGALNGSGKPIGVESATDITTTKLSLSPGKWLIVAKAATTGSIENFLMYIQLMNEANKVISRSGAQAETRSGSAYVATPSLTYLVSVPYKPGTTPGTAAYYTSFSISLFTSGKGTKVTTNAFGALPFYAIRIDREN